MKPVALVTGSTSGIGLAIAKQFAKSGYDVVLSGIEENGEMVARELAVESGAVVHFRRTDLIRREEAASLVSFAQDVLGRVDVLVNNAGIQYVSPIEDFPDEKWEAILALNLSAAFRMTREVWKGMKSRKFGRIINIASAHAMAASEFKAAYVSAKHGIIGLTKVVALEGAPYGITCNAICPGYVRTPLVEQQLRDQMASHGLSEKEIIEKVMLGKHVIKDFVPAEDIAAFVLFLSSSHGRFITGATLPIEAGWNAQ